MSFSEQTVGRKAESKPAHCIRARICQSQKETVLFFSEQPAHFTHSSVPQPSSIMSDPYPSADPADTLESSRSHAVQAAEELRAAASQKVHDLRDAAVERSQRLKEIASQRAQEFRDSASERVEHIRDYAEERWAETRTQLDDLREEGERYVRQNPAKAVLLALGLGFIIGRILR